MQQQSISKFLQIYAAAIVVLCLLIGFLIYSRSGDNEGLAAQVKADMGHARDISHTELGIPSEKLVALMQSRVDQLTGLYAKTRDSISLKYIQMPVLTPLEFKEEILRMHNEASRMAADKNVQLGQDVGFNEYMGEKIPKVEEMPRLCQHLYFIKDLIGLALECKLRRVGQISILPPDAKDDPVNAIFHTINVAMEIQASFVSLVKFLDTIYHRPEVIWVNSISFRRESEGNLVRATLELEVIVDKEPFAPPSPQPPAQQPQQPENK